MIVQYKGIPSGVPQSAVALQGSNVTGQLSVINGGERSFRRHRWQLWRRIRVWRTFRLTGPCAAA